MNLVCYLGLYLYWFRNIISAPYIALKVTAMILQFVQIYPKICLYESKSTKKFVLRVIWVTGSSKFGGVAILFRTRAEITSLF